MKREINRLEGRSFDVTIVGGGIHGSVLALEMAQKGYSVALLEKEDFGHLTSANSLKIIHGGIRYLQHGDLKRVRESILSRRAMMNFAPHIVRPLACLMPTYGHGIRGREMMRLAFGIYDLIAFDRNKGLKKENRLSTGTTISDNACKLAVPGIKEEGLTGGAIWYDAIAENTERLVLEYIKAAATHGACVANYTEVLSLTTKENGPFTILGKDRINDEPIRLNSSVVVKATGSELGRLSSSGQVDKGWASAINIVVKRQFFEKYAVGLERHSDHLDQDAIIKRGKRLFFFVPWQEEYTMIGTSYKPYYGTVDSYSLIRKDVEEMLDEVNSIYPNANLSMDDVSFVHSGLLPMNEGNGKGATGVQLEKSSMVIDHGREGGTARLISIKGVKYTTAPDVAKRVIKVVDGWDLPAKKDPASYTVKSYRKEMASCLPKYPLRGDIQSHLQAVYGSKWQQVLTYFVDNDDTKNTKALWLSDKPPLLVAELYYFIHEEMALNLADVVFRRTNIASAKCPDVTTLARICGIMAKELDWSDKEQALQVDRVMRVFTPWQRKGD